MSDSKEVLLKLVRAAMGWECDFTLPPDIDWKAVLTMATEQGVEAIAIDGYQAIKSKNPNTNLSLDSFENKPLLLEYLGRLRLAEQGNLHRLAALTELSEVLNDQKIPFMLMKGFACSQYYPNPAHRACGDIDIFLGERFEESNNALKAAGIEVNPNYYRHTVSYIKNVMIENHRVLCDLRGPKRQTRKLEIQLETEGKRSMVAGKNVVIGGKIIHGAKFPTANFNALFLPWHVSAHFAFERVNLRQLLYWALFLKVEGREIDLGLFKTAKQNYTYGYGKLADVLTSLSIRYLNMPTDNIPSPIIYDALKNTTIISEKVLDYMISGKLRVRNERVWKFRLNNVKKVWSERWKYQELFNMNVFVFLYYKTKGVVFHEGEKMSCNGQDYCFY